MSIGFDVSAPLHWQLACLRRLECLRLWRPPLYDVAAAAVAEAPADRDPAPFPRLRSLAVGAGGGGAAVPVLSPLLLRDDLQDLVLKLPDGGTAAALAGCGRAAPLGRALSVLLV